MKRQTIAFVLCVFGTCLTITQWCLELSGTSLCPTAGCAIASENAYSNAIYLAGVLFFIALSVVVYKEHQQWTSTILTCALAIETIFIADQIWLLEHICLFCVSVCVLIIVIAILVDLPQQSWTLIVTIDCAIIIGLALISPSILAGKQSLSLQNGVTMTLPSIKKEDKSLYLIYSDNCQHCQQTLEAIRVCTQMGDLPQVNLNNVGDLCNRRVLSALGITSVPVLCVTGDNQTSFIEGADKITEYISTVKPSTRVRPYAAGVKSGCLVGAGTKKTCDS